jgi:hypothetical protein
MGNKAPDPLIDRSRTVFTAQVTKNLLPACEPRPVGALGEFFDELAGHLALGAAAGAPLSTARQFRGPGGMICRIETQRDGAEFVARPLLLLPLDGHEIQQLELRKLLSMQSALLSQLGWILEQSPEGRLQLAPQTWTAQASEVARVVEMGSTVGRMMLAMFHHDEGLADAGSRPGQPTH